MAKANKSTSKRNKLLLLFGFLFFVNPMPLGLDFLPDVFGCILIYFGLTQLAYFDGAVEKARKIALYMIVVEGIKLLLTKSIYLTEIGSNRMLGVTAFSLVEIALYLTFFKQLMDGISYFSMRNNCNQTLAKCDGCAFLCTLSVISKILASLLPELLALVEMRKNIVTDFESIQIINDIMIAKPILVLLLSLLALITCVAWIISLFKLLNLLHFEAGTELDSRYSAEYTSKPQLVRPKQLKRASLVIYVAIFFLANIKVDGIPIAPMWATFLLLFIATFMLGGLVHIPLLKGWALPSFVLLLGGEIFKSIYVPYGAIVIYETPMWIVAVNLTIAVVTSISCLLAVRGLLLGISRLSANLGGEEISVTTPWVAFSVSTALWAVGYTIPYLYSKVEAWRFLAAAVFVWQTASMLTRVNDEEAYRSSLEDPNTRH